MKADQLDKALYEKFVTQDERLVFWNDAKSEFSEYVARGLGGKLAQVKVVDLSKNGGLKVRLLLEEEDTSSKYLVYRAGNAPQPDHDWLLDVRLYSAEFHADIASIWLQELGLDGLYLRDHLKARETFLGSQGRRKKLAKRIVSDDDESAIDLKMMAVVAGSEVANLFSILRAVCDSHLKDGVFDLGDTPKAIIAMDKMGLSEPFWGLVDKTFGYCPAQPRVAALLRFLFVSELFHQLNDASLDALAQFQLEAAGRQNAVVYLTQWRDSSRKARSYDAAAEALSAELNIKEHLGDLSAESLADVYTFWDVEKRMVASLKKRVVDESQAMDVDAITAVAAARKAGHWLAGPGRDLSDRRAIADAYDAIVAAAELFALRSLHADRLTFETAEAFLCAYQEDLFQFDQCYRRFCVKAKAAQRLGWDLLKTLADEVEAAYDQGFLVPLGLGWDKLLEQGFLDTWGVSSFLSQQNFYTDRVAPYLAESSRKRAYVIISDAFRYEAAEELVEMLNGRYRMDAQLEPLLGVLPSYTELGMASLLPHAELSYADNGNVQVDGRSSAGTLGRNKQLASVNGMACQAKDLIGMKTEDAREFTLDKRVVYIYHDVVDKAGEKAEDTTFDAVARCIEELVSLVKFCVNKLNAANVWVTADHGFLYQEGNLDQTDKSTLSCDPKNPAKKNKRFIIGRDLGSAPQEVHQGTTQNTAGTNNSMEFWLPRSTNRFHFVGGAKFVHGGAMPQEVVVPLITVKQLRGESAAKSKVEKVSVQLLGTKHRITTPAHRFELIQTDAVSERRLPLTLRIAVYEGSQAVTSIETLVFDSTSDVIGERQKTVRLKLQSGEFDKAKPYRLVLRDAETDTEVQSVPVIIDRSFDDDF